MQEVKYSTCIATDYDTPSQKALLLTAGIHGIARLALAVTGGDVSDMNNDLIADLESSMKEEDLENFFAKCLVIIESANRRMLSVIIERSNSIEEQFSQKFP